MVALLALLLTGCPSVPPPDEFDFATDPRILRGAYRGSVDTRVWPNAMALSGDGSRLAVSRGNGEGLAQLWDLGRMEPAGSVGRPSREEPWLADLAVDGDGSMVAGAIGGRAHLWDAATGDLVRVFDAAGRLGSCLYCGVTEVDLSADGRFLAAGGTTPRILLFDAGTGEVLHEFDAPGSAVRRVAFSANGSRLAAATAGRDERGERYGLRVWDTASGSVLFAHEGPVPDLFPELAFSGDGRRIAVVSESIVGIVAIDDGETVATLRQEGSFAAAALNPDGTQVAVVLHNGEEIVVEIHDVASGASLARLDGLKLNLASWSDDGRFLLAGSVLVRTSDFAPVRDFVTGRLHGIDLEAVPEYVDRERYDVTGTIRIDGGEPIGFTGAVEGMESQRYVGSQARAPRPASLKLNLHDHPWRLLGYQESAAWDRRPWVEPTDWWGSVLDTSLAEGWPEGRLGLRRAP